MVTLKEARKANDEAYKAWIEAEKAWNETGKVWVEAYEAWIKAKEEETCNKCGQIQGKQTGEYPCEVCGEPILHDDEEEKK